MREFDLGSDADLVFALPDDAVSEKPFWTSVVERLINVISSYTQEGIIFTVDTRLRPMGRDGELVQTESSFKRYFAQKAEAWEGIAYMKARAVAGDLPRGTKFLSELQEVDWRRYGMSSNLGPMLVTMRRKLEMVTELLGRWSGVRPHEKPLADLAAQVRTETRQLFSQIFTETDSPHTAG